MSRFFTGVWVILSLELRQRVRGVAWYVLLGVFFALTFVVTALLATVLPDYWGDDSGSFIYITVVYFVLLLGTLVAPALSGNAINGDRDAGTLATTQVTLITTWQLIIGKFFAAWASALAFLVVAAPFLIFAKLSGGVGWSSILVSLVILAIELGVVAAIGVGLSGLINRPLFSIVATYMVVATLCIGTLIAFGLGGLAVQTTVTTEYTSMIYDDNGEATGKCSPTDTYTDVVPTYDRLWGVLVANPFVVLSDAVPTHFDADGEPTDSFGYVKFGIRSAQIPVPTRQIENECSNLSNSQDRLNQTPEEVINTTTPGWLVGLIIQLVLAAAALCGAWSRTLTPARRLSKGSRIA